MKTDWVAMPPRPSLQASENAVQAALDCAQQRGIAIAVMVVDSTGQLICGKRMDGARPVTAELALAKAHMAAIHQRPTHHFQNMVAPGEPAFGLQHHPSAGHGILPGGLPLTIDSSLCGAVGASGADRDGDLACAEAALAVLTQNRKH